MSLYNLEKQKICWIKQTPIIKSDFNFEYGIATNKSEGQFTRVENVFTTTTGNDTYTLSIERYNFTYYKNGHIVAVSSDKDTSIIKEELNNPIIYCMILISLNSIHDTCIEEDIIRR